MLLRALIVSRHATLIPYKTSLLHAKLQSLLSEDARPFCLLIRVVNYSALAHIHQTLYHFRRTCKIYSMCQTVLLQQKYKIKLVLLIVIVNHVPQFQDSCDEIGTKHWLLIIFNQNTAYWLAARAFIHTFLSMYFLFAWTLNIPVFSVGLSDLLSKQLLENVMEKRSRHKIGEDCHGLGTFWDMRK